MSTVTLLPYSNLGEAIDVSVSTSATGVLVDGVMVKFVEGADRHPFSLSVACAIDHDTLASFEADGKLELILKRISVESRIRDRLEPDTSNGAESAEFTVTVDPAEHFGAITLQPLLLCRSRKSDPAADGLVVGWGPEVTIEIDAKPKPLGNNLPVRWHSFDDDDTIPDGHLFHVRLEEVPTILLNSDVPGLKDILSSKGTTGRKARIRDSVFTLVYHQVWTSLIFDCLLDIEAARRDDPGRSLAEYADDLPNWKQSVTRDWLVKLLDLQTTDDVLDDELPTDTLLERLPALLQQRHRSAQFAFTGMFNEASLFSGEE